VGWGHDLGGLLEAEQDRENRTALIRIMVSNVAVKCLIIFAEMIKVSSLLRL